MVDKRDSSNILPLQGIRIRAFGGLARLIPLPGGLFLDVPLTVAEVTGCDCSAGGLMVPRDAYGGSVVDPRKAFITLPGSRIDQIPRRPRYNVRMCY